MELTSQLKQAVWGKGQEVEGFNPDIQQMGLEMSKEYRGRFVPYIQLHEFEGLLFSDINVYKNNFSKSEI